MTCLIIASSMLTFAGLAGLGVVAGLVYVLLVARGKGHAHVPAARTPRAAPPPLSVRTVVNELVGAGDDETTFLIRASGAFVTLGDELLAILESDEPLEDVIDDDTPFSETQLVGLRKALKTRTLLQLPSKAETKEFLLRERFCHELPDGEAKEQMLKVLRGQTGFRSFDGAVQRLGIDESWRRLRDAELAKIAVAWLRKHGIDFDGGMPDEAELRRAS